VNVTLARGQMVDHFRILSVLGAGGMGVVYLAEDTTLGRKVALKLLPAQFTENKDRLKRFEQEARATSALNHPNIVTIHEVCRSGNDHFIVMEWIEGRTLRKLGRGPVSIELLVRWARQIAQALVAAHAAGIVHRDIKPENIMVRDDGYVKVLDFGLARLTREASPPVTGPEPGITRSRMVVGTLDYMSPEQALGEATASATDIFSLGIILYELTAGKHPFPADSSVSRARGIISRKPESLSPPYLGIPPALGALIFRMLEKDPPLRPTALEVEEELTRVADALGAAKAKRRRDSRYWVGAGAAVALIVLGVVLLPHKRESEGPAPIVRPLRPTLLTTEPGWNGYPAFSPDGTQIAYSWDGPRQDNDDIYLRKISGGPPVRLTTDPESDYSAAWSPDGRSIAFLRHHKKSATELELSLVLSFLPKGPERNLGQLRIPVEHALTPRAVWTPDGKYLIFPDRAGSEDFTALYILNVETGEKRRVTAPPDKRYADMAPAVSPDGRSVAFVRAGGREQTQLFVLPLSTEFQPQGDLRRLAWQHRRVRDPAWTRDGKELIYTAFYLSPAKRLWRVAVSGMSPPTALATVGERGDLPALSYANNMLAYRVSSFDYDIWRLQVDAGGKAKSRQELIASPRPDMAPEYSPDGKRIAFTSGRSGAEEIWVSNHDGSSPVQRTSLRTAANGPRWFPGGRRIVFSASLYSQTDIYVIDADSGEPRRITTDPARDSAPSVSRDGKWIYFSSLRTGRWEVWRKSPESGQLMQLTRNGGSVPVESPDGAFVYYQKAEALSELWKVPVAGGEEVKVLGPIAGNHNFSVCAAGMYFVGQAPSGTRLLQFFDLSTQRVRTISTLGNALYSGIAASPDGRSILYAERERASSDVMLVENFQ
jgi:serine/threonine protein kinase